MKNFPIWLKILIVIVELIIHASAIFMIKFTKKHIKLLLKLIFKTKKY